jgi:hypothetical protein
MACRHINPYWNLYVATTSNQHHQQHEYCQSHNIHEHSHAVFIISTSYFRITDSRFPMIYYYGSVYKQFSVPACILVWHCFLLSQCIVGKDRVLRTRYIFFASFPRQRICFIFEVCTSSEILYEFQAILKTLMSEKVKFTSSWCHSVATWAMRSQLAALIDRFIDTWPVHLSLCPPTQADYNFISESKVWFNELWNILDLLNGQMQMDKCKQLVDNSEGLSSVHQTISAVVLCAKLSE